MKEVTVDIDEIQQILVNNREQHKIDFADAINGYYIEIARELNAAMAVVEARGDVPYIHLTRPESHEEDYDMAIGMLTMHTDDTITISCEDYAKFVNDNWEWKHQWTHTNTQYYAAAGIKK